MTMVTLRKNELMYSFFGMASDGCKCKDCKYFISFKYHDKRYRKCEIYGVTQSEASDWVGKWQACGLYPGIPTQHKNVIRLVHSGKKHEDTQIEGQMSLFGEVE